MIQFLVGCLKYTAFALLVLVASQMEIGGKRICDHVGTAMQTAHVTSSIKALSKKIDFTEGSAKVSGIHKLKGTTPDETVTDKERSQLGSFLKMRR